jgi:hypothetical protein
LAAPLSDYAHQILFLLLPLWFVLW